MLSTIDWTVISQRSWQYLWWSTAGLLHWSSTCVYSTILSHVFICDSWYLVVWCCSGALTAKRNPALSKLTTESSKGGTAATAMHSKPPTSADGKKLAEKKDAVKKTPAKKDAPGLLTLKFLFNLQHMTDAVDSCNLGSVALYRIMNHWQHWWEFCSAPV